MSPTSRSDSRPDLHQTITDKIVAAIEAGAGEWQMPWHRPGSAFSIPRNAVTGAHYNGCNILSLWIDADAKTFDNAIWATFKQWQEIGAQVRKGEKGSLIVKYGKWTPKDARGGTAPRATGGIPAQAIGNVAADGEAAERMYARAAWVFNANQVDGFPVPDTAPRADLTTRLAHVDAFLAATKAEFREGGTRAFYRPRNSRGEGDYIQMPPRHLFTGTPASCGAQASGMTPTEAYEATRLHECAHYAECLIMPRRSLFCRPVRATSAACRHNLVDQHDTDVMRERGRCHSRKDTFVSEVSKGLQDFPARRDAVTLALAFLRTCLRTRPQTS